jgi:hypothetical protein
VYGPVRTVVWQGSAGDRRPYADPVGEIQRIYTPAGCICLRFMFPGLRPLRGLNPGLSFLHRSAVLYGQHAHKVRAYMQAGATDSSQVTLRPTPLAFLSR